MADPVRLSGRWRVQFWYRASVAPSDLTVIVTIRHANGRIEERRIGLVSFTIDRTTNRILVVDQGVGEAEIIDAVATGNFAAIKRGQFYIVGVVVPEALSQFTQDDNYGRRFCRGYLYENHDVVLGDDVEPGPGGGEGFLNIVTVIEDRAGNVATSFTPTATNAFRRVLGFAILYNASGDAATRTIAPTLRSHIAIGSPTGFALARDVWQGPTLTLTVSEEGIYYVYAPSAREGIIVLNDNATLASQSTATVPMPFPLDIGDGILTGSGTSIELTVGAGNANDRYSMYALVEEWLVL